MLMLQRRLLLRVHHIELYHRRLYSPVDKNFLLLAHQENQLELQTPLPLTEPPL